MPRFLIVLLLIAASSVVTAAPLELGPAIYAPIIASDGTDFLAVWSGMRAVRFDRAGQWLDATPMQIAGSGVPFSARYGGGVYLIVWLDRGNLVASRLTPAGELLDQQPLLLQPLHAWGAAAAFDGERFLVTWTDVIGVRGAFIGMDGSVSAIMTFATDTPDRAVMAPDLAWDGRRFLLAWSAGNNQCAGTCSAPRPTEAYLLRLTSGGGVLDAAPMVIPASYAHIASGGGQFLVTIDRQPLDQFSDRGLLALLVAADNGIEVRATIELSNFFPYRSSVAWTGSDYAVSWSYPLPTGDRYRLATVRIRRDGDVAAGRFAVTAQPMFAADPVLTSSSNAAGETAIGIAELATTGTVARIVFERDITTPLPLPPAPPSVSLGPVSPILSWSTSGPVDGFVIEGVTDTNQSFQATALPASQTSIMLLRRFAARVRVRAFNAGGMSEPSPALPLLPPRHRSVR